MTRFARGANCGGKAASGLLGSRVKSRRRMPFVSISPAIEELTRGGANVPRNIVPSPAVNDRRKWRRGLARQGGDISSGGRLPFGLRGVCRVGFWFFIR